MSTSNRSSYHHGALRPALIAAARALLDEGGPEAVGLREAARRVGVSPTATYRHFKDKEALLAALAVEGFREFGAALAAVRKRARTRCRRWARPMSISPSPSPACSG